MTLGAGDIGMIGPEVLDLLRRAGGGRAMSRRAGARHPGDTEAVRGPAAPGEGTSGGAATDPGAGPGVTGPEAGGTTSAAGAVDAVGWWPSGSPAQSRAPGGWAGTRR